MSDAPETAICAKIASQLEIGGWHDAAGYVRSDWMAAHIADLCASGQQARAAEIAWSMGFIAGKYEPDPTADAGHVWPSERDAVLADLTARVEAAQAEAVPISPEALMDLIGDLGREVFYMLDDCETSGPVGEEVHTITRESLEKVSSILDRIDALPFEVPGVILGTGAMLQEAIKRTFAAPAPEAAQAIDVHETPVREQQTGLSLSEATQAPEASTCPTCGGWTRGLVTGRCKCEPAPEAAQAEAVPVGETGEIPGSNGGFTMAVFRAADVPVGAKLYAASPAAPAPGIAEAIAALEALPTRQEALGGQRFHYVQIGEAIAALRALKGGDA